MTPDAESRGAGEYEFVVRGHLGFRTEHAFPDLRCRRIEGATELVGWLPDDAAVHGVLEQCRDLRLELVSMRRLDGGPNAA